MNPNSTFEHLPEGAYFTSSKHYTGLSSIDRFSTAAPIIAIAKRGKLKNTHIPAKIRKQLAQQHK